MMMAAVSTITVILLGFFITCADLQDRCDFHVATNDNFNVPLNVSPKPNEQLKWTHKGTVIFDRKGIKVVAGKEDDVYQNGSLKLRNLDKNKAGIYIPEIYANGRKQGDLKSVAVCVQDRVSKPEVKIECSKPRVKFTCNVKQPAKDVNFEWFHNGKSLQTQRSQTLSQTILKGMEMDMFSCKVSNHVSSITSTTVKQNCTKPKPDTVFPKELLGINTWVFVGTGGGIVLVLIIVIVICCVRNRWKKRAQTKDNKRRYTASKERLLLGMHDISAMTLMRRNFVWVGLILTSSIIITFIIIRLIITNIIITTATTISSSQLATLVLASIAPNSNATSSIPKILSTPTVCLNPTPGDLPRAPDHLQRTRMSSLHLFLSPGRKLRKYSTTDTILTSPSEKKFSKLSREKIKTLPSFVKFNLNKLIVFKFSNYIQFL